jgi:hypothetical protein
MRKVERKLSLSKETLRKVQGGVPRTDACESISGLTQCLCPSAGGTCDDFTCGYKCTLACSLYQC